MCAIIPKGIYLNSMLKNKLTNWKHIWYTISLYFCRYEICIFNTLKKSWSKHFVSVSILYQQMAHYVLTVVWKVHVLWFKSIIISTELETYLLTWCEENISWGRMLSLPESWKDFCFSFVSIGRYYAFLFSYLL